VEFKSLFIGILFSIGVFALKSGVGLFYFIEGSGNRLKNFGFLILFAGVYLTVFYLVFLLLGTIDILDYFNLAQTFFKSGMWMHLAMAALLMGWGLILLKSKPKAHGGLGWLPMVIPCPVCFTVILFSVAFTMSTFPDIGPGAAGLIYGIFMGISLLTAGVLKMGARRWALSKDILLGAIMVLMASYFLLSVTVLPQVGELDKVYRLAAYQGEAAASIPLQRGVVGFIVFAAMTLGFMWQRNKIRREIDWNSERF
jgi:predicted transporter